MKQRRALREKHQSPLRAYQRKQNLLRSTRFERLRILWKAGVTSYREWFEPEESGTEPPSIRIADMQQGKLYITSLLRRHSHTIRPDLYVAYCVKGDWVLVVLTRDTAIVTPVSSEKKWPIHLLKTDKGRERRLLKRAEFAIVEYALTQL